MITGNIAVDVQGVSKIYKLYDRPIDRLKESIIPFRRQYHKVFRAVNNISFQITKGETLGLIGKNGSGKSTLLKMITGVLTPSSGEITVNGKISALLELGAGFNPDFTGIENIYLNGTLLGYSREEIDKKLDSILSFAELGDFIYQPVKVYSSGMFVRLAFAVSINVDPDILIVDEALSVGDMRFQQKCFRKIEEFKESKTVLFVSHDLSIINKFCDRAIWINDGDIMEDGYPTEIAKKYRAFMIGSRISKYTHNQSEAGIVEYDNKICLDIEQLDPILDVLGDNKATITGIAAYDSDTEEKVSIILPGQRIKILIRIQYNSGIAEPIVGFTLKDRLGNIVTQSNSYVLNRDIASARGGQSSVYCFEFSIPELRNGLYSVSPAVASGSQDEHVQHCWVHDALILQVLDKQRYDLEGYLVLNDIDFSEIK